MDLEYALKLLQLPRTVGTDPKSGMEIVSGLGRFGPFVRRDKTFASLRSTADLWTVSVEEAVALLDAKESGRRLPLKELGTHPETGDEISVMSGRYGPYVTDGNVNATLPKGTEPDEVDLEAALALLAEKAAKGGRRGGRGSARGKGAKKKSASRKSAGKKAAPRKKS